MAALAAGATLSVPGAAHAADCTAPVAHLAVVKGNVELVRQGAMRLTAANANEALCAGDSVIVHRESQAALLLTNATVVRLDQGTTVTLSGAGGERAPLLNVVSGAVYVISRTPRPFRVKTPFINANVEGTEFLVEARRRLDDADSNGCTFTARVENAGADRITVFEGRVRIDSGYGDFVIASGESASASATRGPTKEFAVPSRDAVAWTVYVPTVIGASRSLPSRFACAGRRTEEGRIEEAQRELEAIAAQAGDDSALASALLATLALARGDKESAEQLAERAVRMNPKLPAAWLAHSYAEQARFRIDDALSSASRAAELSPDDALALARRAELLMSVGRLEEALASAQRAVRLDPGIAKTQTVLGFSSLVRMDTVGALSAFAAAISLDPRDPLPRLGQGLAQIRQGRLAAGRADLEIAAVLDPSQSLTRSYLGKAYFDERRSRLATSQFKLAKELDPNDPTPWFYDSLRAESESRLVESVDDLVESIRLNGRRAVYRSRLLLDEDLAARSASLARSFLELDLREAATADAALALAADPSSASAHRFLSGLKADEPRHEITRASELLQAQMRQPLGVTPLQSQLSNDRLFTLRSEGPNAAGFNEFGSLFVANGPGAQVQGLVGNRRTSGEQGLFSFIHDGVGIGFSALHFTTQGTRPNGDLNESGQSGFAQWVIEPNTSVLLDLTHQRRDYGDIVSHFDPAAFSTFRNTEANDDVRLGLRHAFSPASSVLLAVNRRSDRDDSDVGISVHTRSSRAEAQHLFRSDAWSLLSGVSWLGGTTTENVFGDIVDSKPRHLTVYAYSTYALAPQSTYLLLGGSYDHLRTTDSGDEHQFNPKLGLIWQPRSEVVFRAAAFRVLRRRINADAGLEPTQTAGFDQFFDDANGTKSWGAAFAADFKPSSKWRAGLTASGRNIDRPGPQDPDTSSATFDPAREREVQAYSHWIVDRTATIALRARHTRYRRAPLATGAEGFEHVETTELPASVKLFAPDAFWSSLTVTYVKQRGRFTDSTFLPFDGRSSFATVDLAVGYRLARRLGNVSLDCANLLDRSFRFQDIGLQRTRFMPARTCQMRLAVDL